jgi:hypothetical protein
MGGSDEGGNTATISSRFASRNHLLPSQRTMNVTVDETPPSDCTTRNRRLEPSPSCPVESPQRPPFL